MDLTVPWEELSGTELFPFLFGVSAGENCRLEQLQPVAEDLVRTSLTCNLVFYKGIVSNIAKQTLDVGTFTSPAANFTV